MDDCQHKVIDSNTWFIKFKLAEDKIDYLWDQIKIAEEENICQRYSLAGNISKSLQLKDPKNIIIDSVFPSLFECKTYRPLIRDHIRKTLRRVVSGSSQPILDSFWVNYQKKTEFNPLHDHSGMFSFVIWMKIPYDYENEKELPWVNGSKLNVAVGNFCFVDSTMHSHFIKMNKDVEGYCCLFPSHLHHMVYPFYTSDENRISISGNIFL